MGDGVFVVVAILAAITYAYFLYIRPAYGKTLATTLAVLVFLLLILVVCRRVA